VNTGKKPSRLSKKSGAKKPRRRDLWAVAHRCASALCS
jgi:hypothetical protein